MKRLFAMVLLLVVSPVPRTMAQGPDDLNEGARMEWDSANSIYRFKWWGRSGRTYFIQQSDDLPLGFSYIPIIEPGTDSIREWGFATDAAKFFLRLRYSEQATSDPFNSDFDGDGISNFSELLNGTDPLASNDTGNNGLPDYWEQFYFGYIGVDANADPDGDGLTNLQEFQRGTAPGKKDNAELQLQVTAIAR